LSALICRLTLYCVGFSLITTDCRHLLQSVAWRQRWLLYFLLYWWLLYLLLDRWGCLGLSMWSSIAVALEVPVIIVPTDWPSLYPPPSPRVELLNIMYMSSLIGGSSASSTSMSSRLPLYSSSMVSPFALAFAANAGDILEQKPVKRSSSSSSSSLITYPVMVQK
jgi:hypothetical protein